MPFFSDIKGVDTAAIIAEKEARIASLEADNSHLKAELSQLKRLIFGQKSERFIPEVDQNQLSIDLGGFSAEPPESAEEEAISYTRKKSTARKVAHPGRHPLPAHLPVEEIIIEPALDTAEMRRIGQQVSESLHMQAARFFIRREIRPKYLEKTEPKKEAGESSEHDVSSSHIHIAPLPARPIPRSMAGASLLACILISKYCDHLPLYRQRKIYQCEGVDIPTSTLSDWVGSVCELLDPLYVKLRQEVLKQEYLMVDESRMPVDDKRGSGKTHMGYQWVYYAPLTKLVLFEYQKGRGKQYPKDTLKDFKGYLQTDGYGVYDSLFDKKEGVELLGCMAHTRRYFDKALDQDRKQASIAMDYFQQLYAIERKAREEQASPQQRYTLRQAQATAILTQLSTWARERLPEVLPKSLMGKALAYYLKREKKLKGYLTDGRLEIDNNYVENAIRPLALGRKNYLFAGSHKAARHAAIIYSFIGSCEKLKLNPTDWLTHVLETIPNISIQDLDRLLPHNCKNPEN